MRWLHLLFLRVLSIRVAEEVGPGHTAGLKKETNTYNLEEATFEPQVSFDSSWID